MDLTVRSDPAYVTVHPAEGRAPEIARALLAAADHPYQVRVVSHPAFGFIVPEDVFERFEAASGSDEVAETVAEEPRKRRPGRPRKVVDTPPIPDSAEEE